MSIPPRIEKLLDGGMLQPIEAPDADVAALWRKAVTSAADARNLRGSPDNEYVLAYQALLQMGTAVLAAAGYRTRGAQGHHATTFYAVAALEIEGLEEIDVRSDRVRRMRKLSAYEPGSPSREQIEELRKLVADTLSPARRWLAASRPNAVLLVEPGQVARGRRGMRRGSGAARSVDAPP
jgi:hypothetical protein